MGTLLQDQEILLRIDRRWLRLNWVFRIQIHDVTFFTREPSKIVVSKNVVGAALGLSVYFMFNSRGLLRRFYES